ncbi:hypothetical protein VY88_02275 [Azospirillum thiophilum]|uniref:FAD assembly factor SdhE n=1 Tax=Azospirillum thiophilum TaxID=528244 RepID=A0AAC8VXU8_9PROT|nr:succinate dehydrogenase assembly factor 2 [Azospirillum thiophilum]ALG71255.1 hypothetical protein AL072_10435 [Azospirillum thiophilum]KJR65089.1 hypothetical protein VY88_02275 [Azospirillum thiophilum]
MTENGTPPAPETAAPETAESLENRRKRLRFRSWHRGTREMDLLMGSFADAHVVTFDHDMLDRFEALLELGDPDLYDWMSGREPVPAEHDGDVMRLLTAFQYTPRQGS